MCGPHHCLGRDAFASGPEIRRRLLQLRQNASILEQGCAGHSPNSANRKHQITRHPWRTSPPLRPSLSFRYTQQLGPSFFLFRLAVETSLAKGNFAPYFRPVPFRIHSIELLSSERSRIPTVGRDDDVGFEIRCRSSARALALWC